MSADHRRYFSWGSVSAWAGTVASEFTYADNFQVESGFGLRRETLTFGALDGNRLEATKRALDYAFEAGIRNAKEEMRKVLGVTESRQ